MSPPDINRAGDAVDWTVERRRWARLRAEVRRALTAGAANYVAQPATVGGESIAEAMTAVAEQVSAPAPELPPPAALHKLAKPVPAQPAPAKPKGVPKTHLKICASDIPSDMETLAQNWKTKAKGEA